ncbi:Major facilitator superfamily domain general substrate transporter [Fusarium albosuccineum]|uniref:Major facilitator superfamily domain general substrate transporter n=1 Tax=Fusarium albosuccineum TaxID=1237068 RepID=A0A8H4L1D2_9HYPO|nr:Major facilitator superfamily domain general substrate transporter [Fusarium albosuccineum]
MSIPLATIQSDIAVRLMPIQFSWALDHSILLISLRSLATLVTLCVLLPGITYCWTNLAAKSSPHRRDSILARASSLLFLAGSMFMMMVTDEALIILGLVISATGSGLPTLCRAMLVSATGEDRAGTMFGMLAAWEVLGFLGCEIGMGALFGVGMTTWIGMPFGLGMLVAVVITVTTWLVPTRLATVTTSTY